MTKGDHSPSRTSMACSGLLLLIFGCGSPANQTPKKRSPALRPTLIRLLEYYDDLYDSPERMLRVQFDSPGYHTRLKSGVMVHPTRESLMYALALLQRDGPKDAQRAASILERVLPMQDKREESSNRGTWPYLAEEPIDQMASVDLNWADFCGAQLAQMLVKHADQLPTTLQTEMRASLRLAAAAIMKRNVAAGYTNIAVLGAAVCVAAGEILPDEKLVEYGRLRMQRVIQLTQKQEEFTEYNSPPYTKVVIAECERALHIVSDQQVRAAASTLLRQAWAIVAKSFHVPTQQWAGPHSRTSKNRLRRAMAEFLSERIGHDIRVHPTMQEGEPRGFAVVPPLPCPSELINSFRDAIREPRELSRTFVPQSQYRYALVGTTWLGKQSCLGSVSASSFWTQRKPIIGYWKTGQDEAVAFRVRFLGNGQDFASMGMRSVQSGRRLLVEFEALRNRGIWHRSLDRPVNGKFNINDLRVRFELNGVGAAAKQIDNSKCELMCGDHKIVIHVLKQKFEDKPVEWSLDSKKGQSNVDGICYSGTSAEFDIERLSTIGMIVAIELLKRSETPANSTLVVGADHLKWNNLTLPD